MVAIWVNIKHDVLLQNNIFHDMGGVFTPFQLNFNYRFIIIASYTANLAAFLTVARLDTPVESLEDLGKQYKVLYAPLNGSSAMTYFQRMSQIEGRFYEIWKDMSLNDSLTPVERSKLAVWDVS